MTMPKKKKEEDPLEVDGVLDEQAEIHEFVDLLVKRIEELEREVREKDEEIGLKNDEIEELQNEIRELEAESEDE
jgi:peptidoglycan hydrolase CwlO-like protein